MTASPDWSAVGARDFAERRSATIGQLVQEWLASPEWGALAANSQRCYRAALARIEPVFGALMPGDWRAAWGQHYLAEQAATPSAANRDLQVLSIVMGRAVRAGLLPSNPVRDVKRLRVVPRDRYVADREIAAFRAHCDRRLLAYLDLKLATGVRQGQLIALRWRDWDQSTERLFVAGAKRGADVEYWGAGVIGALDRCAAAFHGGTVATMRPDQSVICTTRGRPFRRPSHWAAQFQRAMARYTAAGGDHFQERDLRAKVASDVARLRGVSAAQAMLGHRSPQLTERVYVRLPTQVESLANQPDLFEREPDLFDDQMGGLAPSQRTRLADAPPDTSSAESPARSKAAVAARRAKPPASSDAAAAASHSQALDPAAAAASIASPAPLRAARKPDRRRDAGGPARAAK